MIGLSRGLVNLEKVLFVTAHPDDEAMFFAPTISHLASRKTSHAHLLCLSTGRAQIMQTMTVR